MEGQGPNGEWETNEPKENGPLMHLKGGVKMAPGNCAQHQPVDTNCNIAPASVDNCQAPAFAASETPGS
ncbi:unnamed protein product [Caretta caretta]